MIIVQIDKNQLQGAARLVKDISASLETGLAGGWNTTQLNGFTRVSGLDQLGREHAGVLDSGPGSARAVVQGLGEVIGGLARGLEATVQGFEAQEDVFTRSLDRLHGACGEGTGSGSVPAEKLGVIALPEHMTPVPVAVGAKVVIPPRSVIALLRDYFTTHTSAIGEATTAWKGLHASMVDATDRLRIIANDIASANRGEVIDAIVDKLRVTSEATESFGLNAEAMARWSGRMGLTHKLGSAAAGAINGSVMTNPVPGARELQERLALLAYAKVAMPPLLSLAEPRVGSLLDAVVPPSSGGALEAELADLATQSKRDFDGQLEKIRIGDPDSALVHAAQQLSGATHGDTSGGQATVDGSAAPTVTQAVAPAPGNSALSSGVGPVPGAGLASSIGAPGIGGVPHASAIGTTQRGGGAVPVAGRAGQGAGAGRGGTKKTATNPRRAVTRPAAVAGRGSSIAGPSRLTTERPKKGGRVANGFGAGVSSGGVGAAGTGTGKLPNLSEVGGKGGGSAGVPRGSLGTGSASSGAGGRSAGGFGRGMMPVGMGAHKDGKKSRAVKTVLSELEQDANTKAILGETPPMVPGTIGAWARN